MLPVEGTKFRRYIAKLYYDSFENKIPNAEAVRNAVEFLEGKAFYEGDNITMHLWTAWCDDETKDAIYYDMTDSKNRCVKIYTDGWQIVENQIKVLFRRYNNAKSQVEPIPAGNKAVGSISSIDNKIWDDFMALLNIKG